MGVLNSLLEAKIINVGECGLGCDIEILKDNGARYNMRVLNRLLDIKVHYLGWGVMWVMLGYCNREGYYRFNKRTKGS